MGSTSKKKVAKKRAPKGQAVERHIEFEDQGILLQILGSQDINKDFLESFLEVEIKHAHDGLLLLGQDSDVSLLQDLFRQLSSLVSGGQRLTPRDVERAAKMLAADRHTSISNLFSEEVAIGGRSKPIVPKTPNQRRYLEAIKENDVIFGTGPAGTGKTYLAMAMAVSALMKREVSRVVLTRPAVEAGEKLGFLPGSMAEKVNPYLRPLYDALHDMLEYEKAHELVERGQIEVAPLAFMRGRTLSRAFVILDEAQNTSQGQMKMLLTRLGEGSKCVVTGDTSQVDLPRGVRSGLAEALGILKGIKGVGCVQFEHVDVIRHPLVAKIIQAYDKLERDGDS